MSTDRRRGDAIWVSVVALSFAIGLASTWERWGGPLVDTGREMNQPLRLASGDQLYSGVRHIYGPLSPWLHGTVLGLATLAYLTSILQRGQTSYVRFTIAGLLASATLLAKTEIGVAAVAAGVAAVLLTDGSAFAAEASESGCGGRKGAGAGAFLVAALLPSVIVYSAIAARVGWRTLLVESWMLCTSPDFFSGRSNPLREEITTPGYLTQKDEVRAIEQLRRARTSLILITNRRTPEFGAAVFGRDYCQHLMRWIEANYSRCATFGPRKDPSLEIGAGVFFIHAYCAR